MTEEQFLQAYGSFLVQSWADSDLQARFKENPKETLANFGMDAGEAAVNIVPPGAPGDHATAQSQYTLWVHGKEKGSIDFYYPDEPPTSLGTMELSDEDLAAVAGGGDCSCSCTPCCCCT